MSEYSITWKNKLESIITIHMYELIYNMAKQFYLLSFIELCECFLQKLMAVSVCVCVCVTVARLAYLD